ncbi:MAG: hypothetical protein RL670_225 [Actinomycetota bacterium]|jgi:putative hydrolase
MPDPEPNEDDIEALRKFLKGFVPEAEFLDAESLAKIAGMMGDQKPEDLARTLNQAMQNWVSSPDRTAGVDWNLAASAAKKRIATDNLAVTEAAQESIARAVGLANLWLSSATQISELAVEPKLMTRDLWIEDAISLYRSLADPIASKMSKALTDALRESAPEELGETVNSLTGMLEAAGGAMFAMQLGQALGNLSTEALTASDLGLSIFAEPRPGFVVQNLLAYIDSLEVDQDAALIYFAVREIASARLFKHSRWLREQVVTQISAYASELTADIDRLAEIAENFDPNRDVNELFEQQNLVKEPTDEQRRALENIETLLALIEGWVDVVTAEATKLLPQAAAIAEAVRRRRATGGPAEKTFATLVGLELRPRKLREASALWAAIGDSLGNDKRDALWSHPDQLPTAEDIANPAGLIARIKNGGDDLDQELRKLLEG